MIEFRIHTTVAKMDNLSDQLFLLGTCAVSFVDADNQPLLDEMLPEQDMIVVAHFEDDHLQAEIADYLESQSHAGVISAYTVTKLDERDWVRVSLDQFQPQKFGNRLWICPPWFEPPHPDDVNVMLDPGHAFGTGTHPTTKLCLEWLDANIHGGEKIIDYGCGSGILAIAALKLGAAYVDAVDNERAALLACAENAERNGISSDRYGIFSSDEFRAASCDVLIANILLQPLLDLAPLFASFVKPGGNIVLSGILQSQLQPLLDVYGGYFKMGEVVVVDDWVRVEGRRLG